MNTIAIIPARGGSKGIPGKNIIPLGGIPLIAHTIRHARGAPAITRVFVSTDSNEISAVATTEGAEIIRRPTVIAGDAASSELALLHALDAYKEMHGLDPDRVVFLQATSPLRASDDIDNALAMFDVENADSLFTGCPLEGFLWRNDAEGLRAFSYDHRKRPRRQDAPEDLVENGSIYIFKPWVLRECNNRLGGRIAVYRQKWIYSFQIDTHDDLDLIERLFALQQSGASLFR